MLRCFGHILYISVTFNFDQQYEFSGVTSTCYDLGEWLCTQQTLLVIELVSSYGSHEMAMRWKWIHGVRYYLPIVPTECQSSWNLCIDHEQIYYDCEGCILVLWLIIALLVANLRMPRHQHFRLWRICSRWHPTMLHIPLWMSAQTFKFTTSFLVLLFAFGNQIISIFLEWAILITWAILISMFKT